jgi:4-aminobutyrate aminotransferase-like enzyme
LLILGCGTSTARLIPALNVTEDTVEEGVRIFEQVLTESENTV